MARVLVADDDRDLLLGVEIAFQREGHQVACVSESTGVLYEMAAFKPDVILLAIMMPGMDGWDVCRSVRQVSQVPIIFLSALRGDRDVVDGLEMGGDDYVTKPFSLVELLARVEAVLRRVDMASQSTPAPALFDDGDLFIELATQTVRKRGQEVHLSAREFHLLAVLLRSADRVVTHEQILRAVWGRARGPQSNHVTQYVRYLRLKLEDDPSTPRYLRTRQGLGYYFCGQADADLASS